MSNLIKSELFKLRKDRSLWTILFLLFSSAIGYTILFYYDKESLNNFYPNVLVGNSYILKIAPCIFAGFFISSEYSNGVIKNSSASGNSRIRIYFTKLFVFSLGSVFISLVFPIVVTGFGAILFGFEYMPALPYFARTISLIILYSFAFAAIMALFSNIFTDSGKAIGFLIIFFLLFANFLYALGQKIPVLELIYNYSVFKLLADSSSFILTSGELTKVIIVPCITFIGCGFLGAWIFLKKEIK